jgi:integrase
VTTRKRNLFRRGKVWYTRLYMHGDEVVESTGATTLEEAKAILKHRRTSLVREREAALPRSRITFAEAARETLDDLERDRRHSGAHVSASTLVGHRRVLNPNGPVLQAFGELRIDKVDRAVLRRWYHGTITQQNRSPKTGQNRLDTLRLVFDWARDHGHIGEHHDPVGELRRELRRKYGRTKAARAERDEKRNLAKRGVMQPGEFARLERAARDESTEGYLVVLLGAECGLRRGELHALTWGCINWGEDERDPTRYIEVRASNSSGLGVEPPKSGEVRWVPISRRVRQALLQLYRDRWEPGPDERIIRQNYWDLSTVTLRRICERAGLPHTTFQHLRATCGTLLTQWLRDPEWVRAVVGWKGAAVAEAHYLAIDFRGSYRAPERLHLGENPMDLFERLCAPAQAKTGTVTGTARRKPPRLLRADGVPNGNRTRPEAPQAIGNKGLWRLISCPTLVPRFTRGASRGSAELAFVRGENLYAMDWLSPRGLLLLRLIRLAVRARPPDCIPSENADKISVSSQTHEPRRLVFDGCKSLCGRPPHSGGKGQISLQADGPNRSRTETGSSGQWCHRDAILRRCC